MTRADDIDPLARLVADTRDLLNEHITIMAAFVYIGIPLICFISDCYCRWENNK